MSALLLGCRAEQYPSTARFRPVCGEGTNAQDARDLDAMVLVGSDEAAVGALEISRAEDRVALRDRCNRWSTFAFPFAGLEQPHQLDGCTWTVNWTARGARNSTTRGEHFVNGVGVLQTDGFESSDLTVTMSPVDLWRYRLGVSGLFATWDRTELAGDMDVLSLLSGTIATPENRDRGAGLKRAARAFVEALLADGWTIG